MSGRLELVGLPFLWRHGLSRRLRMGLCLWAKLGRTSACQCRYSDKSGDFPQKQLDLVGNNDLSRGNQTVGTGAVAACTVVRDTFYSKTTNVGHRIED